MENVEVDDSFDLDQGLDNPIGDLMDVKIEAGLEPIESSSRQSVAKTKNLIFTCTVCGDKSAGIFYGAHSCEGCKGFFRRTVLLQKNDYQCINTGIPGRCEINQLTRNQCKHCRLKKCYQVGMTPEGVKAVMKKGVPSNKSKKNPSSKISINSKKRQLSYLPPIEQLKQSFQTYFPQVAEPFQVANIKPILLSDKAMSKKTPYYKHVMFSAFCDNYAPFVDNVAQFCKNIPEFDELPDDDQLILLKTGFVDVWLLLNAPRLNKYSGALTLWDGTQIPQCELSVIFSKHFMATLLKLCEDVNQVKVTVQIMSILVALALVCPDRPNLIAEEPVRDIQDALVYELQHHLSRLNRPESLPQYMSVLSSVYDLGKMHSQIINSYRSDIDKLTLDPIVSQLLDLLPANAIGGKGKEKSQSRTQ